MIEVVRRGDGWTMKRDMLDQMRQSTFIGPTFDNEAAFVAHEQRNARFLTSPGQDREPHTIRKTSD